MSRYGFMYARKVNHNLAHTPDVPKVYRLMVSATGRIGRRKRPVQYGYMGWTADQTAAWEYLQLAETTGVSVRTNQDRSVYRWVKREDGTVQGYATQGE